MCRFRMLYNQGLSEMPSGQALPTGPWEHSFIAVRELASGKQFKGGHALRPDLSLGFRIS